MSAFTAFLIASTILVVFFVFSFLALGFFSGIITLISHRVSFFSFLLLLECIQPSRKISCAFRLQTKSVCSIFNHFRPQFELSFSRNQFSQLKFKCYVQTPEERHSIDVSVEQCITNRALCSRKRNKNETHEPKKEI